MPTNQSQFDADFYPLMTNVQALCTAVDNLNLSGDDLSAEEQAVVDAAAKVQTSLNKLVPPPPPKPQP